MKLYGSTKIYGIVLKDVPNDKTYNITGTVRDLYQTYIESKDEVKILLPSTLMGQGCLAEVTEIRKSDYDGSVYQIKDIFNGLSEELAGLDSSLYCSGDTLIALSGRSPEKASLLISNPLVQISKFEVDNPDFYEFKLRYKDPKYMVTNLTINSTLIMLENKAV